MTALVVLEAVVLVLLSVLVAGLLRSHATILRTLHELGAGVEQVGPPRPGATTTAAPRPPRFRVPEPGGRPASSPGHDIVGVGLDDEAVAVRVVGAPSDTLVVFLSSGCSTCGSFWEALADPHLAPPGGARLVVVVQDASEEHPKLLAELAPPGIQVLHSSAAWKDYAVPGSPYVVLVDGSSGRLRGEGTGQTLEQVLSMLGRADEDAAHRARLDARRGDKARADAAREATVDEELLAAGIQPGDPSLYQPADERAAR